MLLKSRATQWFLVSVAIAVVVKIWLTSEIRIVPVFGPHDSLNFVEHAKNIVSGNWFGPYSDMTLIKGPSFPIYLAFIEGLGIPLPLAHQLLYAVACFVACLAVRPIVRDWKWLTFVFTVLYFNPFSFSSSAWMALRSQINDSFSLIAVACATALFMRRKAPPRSAVPWLIGLGASFAFFSFNREESIWLLPAVVAGVAAYLWSSRKEERATLRVRALVCAIPVAIWIGYWGTLCVENGLKYGWYTPVEMTSSEYVSAYSSLGRIIPPAAPPAKPNANGQVGSISIPRAAREIAYSVSPAARELRPWLEGAPGRGWIAISCGAGYSCDDIPDGWLVWALRDAVQAAGHYSSGAEARAFYVRLADEIDRACDHIRCRPKGHTLSPPVSTSDIPAFFANFWHGVRLAITFGQLSVAPWGDSISSTTTTDEYELVTRAVLPAHRRFISGWIIDDKLRSVSIVGQNGPEVYTEVAFKPSPDVFETYSHRVKNLSQQARIARFTITTACITNCELAVDEGGKEPVRIPTDTEFQGGHITYHVDSIAEEGVPIGEASFKGSAMAEVARTYQSVIWYWVMLALGLTVFRIVRARRTGSPFGSEQLVVTLGALFGLGAHIAILAYISTISFPAFTLDYMISIPALLLFWVVVVTAGEGQLAYRVLQRYAPRRRGMVEPATRGG
jgi:hypothetical protein